jgi:hypothetical protein
MTPVDQTRFYVEGESAGNCMQAVLASILDLPLEAIPDFTEDVDQFWDSVNNFLAGMGLRISPVEEPLIPRDVYYLVAGMSSRGVMHQVIYRNGELAHDPHPSREGLLEKTDVEMLVPLDSPAE